MLYKVILNIKTLTAYGKKVEERILTTHIGCTGRVTECQVAVVECAYGKHGPFLTGIGHIVLHDERDIYQHIGCESGKLHCEGTLTVGIVRWKNNKRSHKEYVMKRFYIFELIKLEHTGGIENGQGFGGGL